MFHPTAVFQVHALVSYSLIHAPNTFVCKSLVEGNIHTLGYSSNYGLVCTYVQAQFIPDSALTQNFPSGKPTVWQRPCPFSSVSSFSTEQDCSMCFWNNATNTSPVIPQICSVVYLSFRLALATRSNFLRSFLWGCNCIPLICGLLYVILLVFNFILHFLYCCHYIDSWLLRSI